MRIRHDAGLVSYHMIRGNASEYGMRRLCGLILFSFGAGMISVLVFPKNLYWVCTALAFLVIGYYLFCC